MGSGSTVQHYDNLNCVNNSRILVRHGTKYNISTPKDQQMFCSFLSLTIVLKCDSFQQGVR